MATVKAGTEIAAVEDEMVEWSKSGEVGVDKTGRHYYCMQEIIVLIMLDHIDISSYNVQRIHTVQPCCRRHGSRGAASFFSLIGHVLRTLGHPLCGRWSVTRYKPQAG